MEKYDIKEELGDGAFGTVYKAVNTETNEIVAIKKMKKKFTSWEECRNLREVKSLIKLDHPHIMFLKEVLRVKEELYLVFEYLSANLFQTYQKMKEQGKTFNVDQIKSMIYQCASALAYMHKHGFFHRDLKPENILIHRDKAKLADFGLAREVRSKPPYTDYVSTRWYRAPELILKSTNYNSPVDIWALGCIMGELYLSTPMFAGNSELDQMYKICSTLGTPSKESWPDGHKLASQIGVTFPQFSPMDLQNMIPTASSDAINLIQEMLKFDPQKRITAKDILSHPYFYGFEPNPNILFNNSAPLPEAKSKQTSQKKNQSQSQYKPSPRKEERKDSYGGSGAIGGGSGPNTKDIDIGMNFSTPGISSSKKTEYNFTTSGENQKTESGSGAGFAKWEKDGDIDLDALEKDLRETPTTEKNQYMKLAQQQKLKNQNATNSGLGVSHHHSDSSGSHFITQSKSSNKLSMPPSNYGGKNNTGNSNNNNNNDQYSSSLISSNKQKTTFGMGDNSSNNNFGMFSSNSNNKRPGRWGGGTGLEDDILGKADRHSSLGRYNPNTDRLSGVYSPDVDGGFGKGGGSYQKSDFGNKFGTRDRTDTTGGGSTSTNTGAYGRNDRSPVRGSSPIKNQYGGGGPPSGNMGLGGQNTITSPPKSNKFKHENDALTDFLNQGLGGGGTGNNMFKPSGGGQGYSGQDAGKGMASSRFDSYSNFQGGSGQGQNYGGMSKSGLNPSGSNANYFGSNVNLQMPVEDGFYGRYKS